MTAHAVTYSGKKFVSSVCTESFNAKAYLDQHFQGAHSGGWQALCGLNLSGQKLCTNMNTIAKTLRSTENGITFVAPSKSTFVSTTKSKKTIVIKFCFI